MLSHFRKKIWSVSRQSRANQPLHFKEKIHYIVRHGLFPSRMQCSTAVAQRKSIFKHGPVLPIFERIYGYFYLKNRKLFNDRIIFILGEHALSPVTSFVEGLIAMGACPQNIFIITSNYPYNSNVLQQLIKTNVYCEIPPAQFPYNDRTSISNIYRTLIKVQQRISELKKESLQPVFSIVSDSNGRIINAVSQNNELLDSCAHVIGVSQDSIGVSSARSAPFPVVELSSAFAKIKIENSMNYQAVVKKGADVVRKISDKFKLLSENMKMDMPVCAITAMNDVGFDLLKHLIQAGYKKIIIYDRNASNVENAMSWVKEFYYDMKTQCDLRIVPVPPNEGIAPFSNANIIFSCSGVDITKNILKDYMELRNVSLQILVNCSSTELEFYSLLHGIQRINRERINSHNRMGAIICKHKGVFGGQYITCVEQGGMPVFLDRTLALTDHKEAQFICGLKLLSLVQSAQLIVEAEKKKVSIPIENYKLDPAGQAFILNTAVEVLGDQAFSDLNDSDIVAHLTDLYNISGRSGGKNSPFEQGLVENNNTKFRFNK